MNVHDALETIAGRHGLQDVYVFGSRALEVTARVREGVEAVPAPGTATSDLDVAVQPLPGRKLGARDRVRLADALETLFGVPRVDLVVLSEASPSLAVDVVRGELLYSSDPLAQARHELYILRRAADLAPYRRERVRAILHEGAR
ncbi:MAG: nucleotidyltransferase domain-containing protein [Longimicrobiales bacterium]|nr:nucleotidyltransferase domain-containing protein [Longimicrobiales bacterium]